MIGNMFSPLRTIIGSTSIKRIWEHSYKIGLHNGKNHALRPANYSNCGVIKKVVPAAEKTNGYHYILKHHFCFKHNEAASVISISESLEKFNSLLQEIEENKNELSVHQVKSYIHDMRTLSDDVLLEDHHLKRLLKNEGIITLFKRLLDTFDEMDDNELINALQLCRLMEVPFNCEVCRKMISKLENNFENLNFSNMIQFFFYFLKYCKTFSMDKESRANRLRPLGQKILKDLESKTYLNSSNDTALALTYIMASKYIPLAIEQEVMSAVLGLTVWDHWMFFKFGLNMKPSNPMRKLLNERYVKRIKDEIHLPNNIFLSYVLSVCTEGTRKSVTHYDKDFVDDVVNKLIRMKLRSPEIRRMLVALSKLRHSHYGFVEYLLNFLKRNPNILVSHPDFSYHIIDYVADCNCNYKEQDLWSSHLRSILTENPNLTYTLQFWRNDMDRYFYYLLTLSSLEVFIDEELEHLSGVCRGIDFLKLNKKLCLFLLNLNHALKIFCPNFSKPILSDEALRFVLTRFNRIPSESKFLEKAALLRDVEKHLKTTSSAINCTLVDCFTKSGLQFDGLVAMNNEGQLYDFGEAGTRLTFVEDVRAATEYKLISFLTIHEKECSRNTLDLKSVPALRFKTQIRSGFPTVIIYEHIFRNLNDDEKKDYLRDLIANKTSYKKEAENYAL